MKEIGETFKEARENIGISVNEVCNDLGVTQAQIENLEDGNINAFKDVFFLKNLINSYAKYLNLNVEEISEEYDSYMFDYTTKISVEDIVSKSKELELKDKDVKKIISPYTKKSKKFDKNRWISVGIISLIAVLVLGFVIYGIISGRTSNDRNRIVYMG